MNCGSAMDYLRAIHDATEQGGGVGNATLARALGVRPPSVTGMVERLCREGLVARHDDRTLRLTAKGRRAARSGIRRHRLIETWLIRSLGLGWTAAHEEAHRLEHALSPTLEGVIAERLGHPKRDPHGAPIPDADGHFPSEASAPLSDLADGEGGTVVRLSDRQPEKLGYWRALGLTLGARVRRLGTEAFGGPVALSIRGRKALVGAPVLQGVWVRRREAGHE